MGRTAVRTALATALLGAAAVAVSAGPASSSVVVKPPVQGLADRGDCANSWTTGLAPTDPRLTGGWFRAAGGPVNDLVVQVPWRALEPASPASTGGAVV